MTRSFALKASAATLALTLSACGGGGTGSHPSFTPDPPATPTPTPTPTCATPPCYSKVDIFPDIKASTDFAVLGLEAKGGNSTTLTKTGFSVRYDATVNSYIMDFPSTQPGTFYQYAANSPNDAWWGGTILDADGTPVTRDVSVLKPSNPELQLTYTTLIGYNYTATGIVPFGWAAFGTATPSGAVPATGSASYSALVRGSSVDSNGLIEGTASLLFNFGAGQLSGHFDPVYFYLGGMGESYPLGQYGFVNTVYSTGSTTFSGQLSNPSVTGVGSFNGMFTGPNAQELMSSWSAPYHDPITKQDSQMFGVWVGSR